MVAQALAPLQSEASSTHNDLSRSSATFALGLVLGTACQKKEALLSDPTNRSG